VDRAPSLFAFSTLARNTGLEVAEDFDRARQDENNILDFSVILWFGG
jgi:hypothetical protein